MLSTKYNSKGYRVLYALSELIYGAKKPSFTKSELRDALKSQFPNSKHEPAIHMNKLMKDKLIHQWNDDNPNKLGTSAVLRDFIRKNLIQIYDMKEKYDRDVGVDIPFNKIISIKGKGMKAKRCPKCRSRKYKSVLAHSLAPNLKSQTDCLKCGFSSRIEK